MEKKNIEIFDVVQGNFIFWRQRPEDHQSFNTLEPCYGVMTVYIYFYDVILIKISH